MSSIPRAIRPPEAPVNPLDQFTRIQGVKGMIQQQQLEQQKIQENQINLNDQKSASDAMHAWDGQNLDDLPGLYIKSGASAHAVLALKSQIQDYVAKKATTDEAHANTTKVNLENEATMHGNIADGLKAIAGLPVDAQADAYEKFKSNPDVVNSLDPNQKLQFVQGLDGLRQRAKQGEDTTDDAITHGTQHLAEAQLSKRASDLLIQNQAATSTAKLKAQNTWLAANPGKTAAD